MIGVEAHRPANPLDPFLGTSEPREELTLLHDNEVAVRIEAKRAILMIGRLSYSLKFNFSAARIRCTSASLSSSERAICNWSETTCTVASGYSDHVPPRLAGHASFPGVGVRIVRIDLLARSSVRSASALASRFDQWCRTLPVSTYSYAAIFSVRLRWTRSCRAASTRPNSVAAIADVTSS